ncbi:hypothetical protein MBLNU457_5968t1 [Dothideomycetes sp. NU457]
MGDASKGSIHSFLTQPAKRSDGAQSEANSTQPSRALSEYQVEAIPHSHDGHQSKKRKISGGSASSAAGPCADTEGNQDMKQITQDVPEQFEASILGSSRGQALSRTLASSLQSVQPETSDPTVEGDANDVQQNIYTESTEHFATPPPKMLKLNAKGTLGSPVSKKNEAKPASKRGRKKKDDKHLLARCRYAGWPSSATLGPRISRILEGQERYTIPAVKVQPSTKPPIKSPKSSRPAKSTHPFFTGKSKDRTSNQSTNAENTAQPQPSPRKSFASTPGKIRMEVQKQRAQQHDLSDGEVVQPRKTTSMGYVVWPSRDMMHVRGNTETIGPPNPTIEMKVRKKKYKSSALDNRQSVLRGLRDKIGLLALDDRRLRADGFYDPPPSLRVPERLLITGPQIQGAVSRELSRQSQHPALMSVYRSIESGMNPYDDGRSEPNAWALKYAPQKAEEVLQPGTEAMILRDWMQALTVISTEMRSSQSSKQDASELKPRKKRRKRAEDLDDFIVDDESDVGQLEELPALENSPSERGAVALNKRTVVRSGIPSSQSSTDARKTPNAIVISGPHGCGKTAMVYAVAKELGFQVFEINSGTRRSGKDVLERVGDMVENHLVSRQNHDAGNVSADEDSTRLSKALTKDLESGRQGTMNTFFKPKAKVTPAPLVPKPKKTVDSVQVKALSKTKTAQNQKQSLILLEEVDVLFEQDKNFWGTVLELIVNSKRPVVITCTDENVVPLRAMSLHAILRLSTPGHDVLTDYLLLTAAREGHLLHRDAVSSLLQYKRHDLRACIAELHFWCQMGVGDPRGGLSWMFQRWPPGKGIDSEGRKQRVVSQGVYPQGIGCIPQEDDATMPSKDPEELMLECWENWQINPFDDLHISIAEHYESEDLSTTTSAQSRLKSLQTMDRLCGSMSAFDVCCRIDLPDTSNLHSRHAPLGSFIHETRLDPTLPALSEKARLNYIEGSTLLQTDEQIDYTRFDRRLAASAANLSSRIYGMGRPLLKTQKEHFLSRISDGLRPHAASIPLSRLDFSAAFDPISEVAAHTSQFALAYSAFDGPLSTISEDIAPYVRSIVQFDLALEEQRTRLSSLLGGTEKVTGKRSRTTRAARSALEGGKRETTRRERWFPKELDLKAVLATGGKEWPRHESSGPRSVGDVSLDDTSIPGSAPGSQVESSADVSAVPMDT